MDLIKPKIFHSITFSFMGRILIMICFKIHYTENRLSTDLTLQGTITWNPPNGFRRKIIIHSKSCRRLDGICDRSQSRLEGNFPSRNPAPNFWCWPYRCGQKTPLRIEVLSSQNGLTKLDSLYSWIEVYIPR